MKNVMMIPECVYVNFKDVGTYR